MCQYEAALAEEERAMLEKFGELVSQEDRIFFQEGNYTLKDYLNSMTKVIEEELTEVLMTIQFIDCGKFAKGKEKLLRSYHII